MCLDESECPKVEPSRESNSDMKRKQSEVVFEQHYPNKYQRNGKGNAFKHQKGKERGLERFEANETSNQNQLNKLTMIY